MKTRLLMIMAFALAMCLPAMADNDRVITFDKLPAAAQTLLNTHFADRTPLIITAVVEQNFPGAVIVKLDRDRKCYGVKLDNGLELELNKNFQIVDMDD